MRPRVCRRWTLHLLKQIRVLDDSALHELEQIHEEQVAQEPIAQRDAPRGVRHVGRSRRVREEHGEPRGYRLFLAQVTCGIQHVAKVVAGLQHVLDRGVPQELGH